MKIAFFDSGIGGLTVLKEALKLLPGERFLYYADTANVPYGTKTREEVRRFIFDGVKLIAGQGVKALVIACNTATSIAIADLRRKYNFPILGMEPAVKPAVTKCLGKRVLVLATPLTLKEEKFQNLVCKLDSEHIVDALALQGLVNFAEKFIFERNIVIPYMKEMLMPFDIGQYGTVVLGCTHFPFYRSFFKEIFAQGTEIIDGSVGTVKHLKNILLENNDLVEKGESDITFICSGKKMVDDSRFIKYLEILN